MKPIEQIAGDLGNIIFRLETNWRGFKSSVPKLYHVAIDLDIEGLKNIKTRIINYNNLFNSGPSVTIRQLYDQYPQGTVIEDREYLYLCAWMDEKGIPFSIPTMSNMVQGLFDMTPENALIAIDTWIKKNSKNDPDFLKRARENIIKDYMRD